MKDFDKWNVKKKSLENRKTALPTVAERQIWWMSLGLNIGDEEDGKGELFERPVLILKKFNYKIAWIVPLSSKTGNTRYYFKIHYQGKESFVILSQIKLISIQRWQRYLGKLSESQFISIKEQIRNFLK